MSGRGSERGWGSVWSSQPRLLSHLQPLSLFLHSDTHTHTRAYSAHSLSVSHTHANTHTPDDKLATRQQHTTACHFCIHSITILLITCKLISRCPWVTSITLTTKSTTSPDFLRLPTLHSVRKKKIFVLYAVPTLVQPQKFSSGITPLVIKFFSKWPKLVHTPNLKLLISPYSPTLT